MSIDRAWVEASRQIVEYSPRPGPEWFSIAEFAEQFGWTDDKAKGFMVRRKGQFEKRKIGARSWWRVIEQPKRGRR